MSNSWQHSSVEDFFNSYNWRGNQTTADKVLQEIPWLCQKIEDFFSRSNWQGGILSEIGKSEFSMTLSVAGFFQFFAWESNSNPTFISKLKPMSELNVSPDNELKIDDFGSLF